MRVLRSGAAQSGVMAEVEVIPYFISSTVSARAYFSTEPYQTLHMLLLPCIDQNFWIPHSTSFESPRAKHGALYSFILQIYYDPPLLQISVLAFSSKGLRF